jgi:hypothetical protein
LPELKVKVIMKKDRIYEELQRVFGKSLELAHESIVEGCKYNYREIR